MCSGYSLTTNSALLRGLEYFFQKTNDLFPGILFWRVFPGQMSYQLINLAPVEPHPVFIAAHVDEYFWLLADGCFFHFMATDGALSLLL